MQHQALVTLFAVKCKVGTPMMLSLSPRRRRRLGLSNDGSSKLQPPLLQPRSKSGINETNTSARSEEVWEAHHQMMEEEEKEKEEKEKEKEGEVQALWSRLLGRRIIEPARARIIWGAETISHFLLGSPSRFLSGRARPSLTHGDRERLLFAALLSQ
jgi:hypothetical protein